MTAATHPDIPEPETTVPDTSAPPTDVRNLPAPDPHRAALTVLQLIELGPQGVRCTLCGAGEHQPCHGLDRGHHRERGWLLRNYVIATLRHHLGLPIPGSRADVDFPPSHTAGRSDQALLDVAALMGVEAHPALVRWRVETLDGGEWLPMGSLRTDSDGAHRARVQLDEAYPLLADGSPVLRRVVRQATSYTVEPTPGHIPTGSQSSCGTCGTRVGWVDCPTGGWWSHAVHPEDGHDARPQPGGCPAGLMPAGGDLVEVCVFHGAHSLHRTAAGETWRTAETEEVGR